MLKEHFTNNQRSTMMNLVKEKSMTKKSPKKASMEDS